MGLDQGEDEESVFLTPRRQLGVLVRQRDLGRRRALGADRPTIITLVVTRTLIAATLGALAGTAAAVVITTSSGVRAPAGFIGAVAILALLTAAIAAIPPAAIAAYRDPVAVLRTPRRDYQI